MRLGRLHASGVHTRRRTLAQGVPLALCVLICGHDSSFRLGFFISFTRMFNPSPFWSILNVMRYAGEVFNWGSLLLDGK